MYIAIMNVWSCMELSWMYGAIMNVWSYHECMELYGAIMNVWSCMELSWMYRAIMNVYGAIMNVWSYHECMELSWMYGAIMNVWSYHECISGCMHISYCKVWGSQCNGMPYMQKTCSLTMDLPSTEHWASPACSFKWVLCLSFKLLCATSILCVWRKCK
jgi:hypothetical protein